ncbi:hypothetical protein JW887_00925, partial [Candidatus Dojkabacteria bacterium]|nr:hypothetical protein [Candidatus Dojkabacteria bacterium]
PNYAGVKAAAWSSRYMDDLRSLSRSIRAAENAAEEGKKVAKIEKAVEEIAKEAPVSNQHN